ncbi:MAG: hypothetical protein HND53_05340 [Proteobacteria bacterium]|nr:hypothetical protein [Pseudomonadota bacterium]NOG59905.1 hypothetical protein [Pseudomonadota bacterium]
MIKQGYINKQIKKTFKIGQTTSFIKQFVFSVVDRALRERYGKDYSMKCLQSSYAIQSILSSMGIKSTLYTGGVCFAEVYKNEEIMNWSGFWDKDHHVWLLTEFREIVDLTICELHLHPSTSRNDVIPIPPLWWNDLDTWPPVIRYLPEGEISIMLPEDEMEDLEEFKTSVLNDKDNMIRQCDINDVKFSPIMEGVKSINILTENGNPWLCQCIKFQDMNIPFPTWVQNRINEYINSK